MRLAASCLLLSLFSTAALAQDDEEGVDETSNTGASSAIQDLLGSIPEIEDKKAPEGPVKPPPEQSFPQYSKTVNDALLQAWAPKKSALKDPKAVAQLTIKLDSNGAITEVRPLKLSGNKKFDQSVLDVMNTLEAVPAPPSSLMGSASQGMVVTFPAAWAIKKSGG